MSLTPVIIHKGRREEKYRIYVEDYVLSFLKEETGTLEVAEFSFYGYRQNANRQYRIYGAGRGRDLAVFDKYDRLDEIGCRLTQAGPVFLVREENNIIYEVKGYDVFYQANAEMQNYLIDRHRESGMDKRQTRTADQSGNADTCNIYGDIYGPIPDDGRSPHARSSYDGTKYSRAPHSMISAQLCVILVVLVAIAINSTNSYNKMVTLNQSAEEVFFAMENQEARDTAATDEVQDDIAVTRDDAREEDALKLVALENRDKEASGQEEDADTAEPENTPETAVTGEAAATADTVNSDTADKDAPDGDVAETEDEDGGGPEAESYDEVEALSRNVARYYEVERGDTLYTISKEIYGDTDHVSDICEINKISDPDHIRYGQKIILP